MKKILLTNNFKIVDMVSGHYDYIYTDSPYVIENYNSAIYLDTLLDRDFGETINNIRKKGYEINEEIINIFFPKYKNRNINLLDIKQDFTNIFINVTKLMKLINVFPNDEITIGITNDELYNYKNPSALDKYVNVYYWIAELHKIKNINLIKIDSKRNDLDQDHMPIDSWFLRLVDLDKRVLFYNLLKKIKLTNKNKKKKIYIYKKSPVLREIEAYLYSLGFSIIEMPEIKFKFDINNDDIRNKKINSILDKYFNNNTLNKAYKATIFEVYKKRLQYYFQKEIYSKDYILNLDKSANVIITNTINNFDSHIFAKQLQQSGFKIVNVIHGFLKKIN